MSRILLKLSFIPTNKTIEVFFNSSISFKDNMKLLKDIIDFQCFEEYVVVDFYNHKVINTEIELNRLSLNKPTHFYIYFIHGKIVL